MQPDGYKSALWCWHIPQGLQLSIYLTYINVLMFSSLYVGESWRNLTVIKQERSHITAALGCFISNVLLLQYLTDKCNHSIKALLYCQVLRQATFYINTFAHLYCETQKDVSSSVFSSQKSVLNREQRWVIEWVYNWR